VYRLVGRGHAMERVQYLIERVARTDSNVLILGESGTGKEVIARAIHCLSPRRERPFVSLNCAALSETLLESELFGHEKGAFTGATGERKGRFELADGGTLFLDEIGEVSPGFQTKLLRVLQEREFERVGGSRPIKVDVRLICATNRNLEEAVGKGTFREDLYFRINVVTVFLPPLRERREDIPPLVEHFLSRYNEESHRAITLSPEALQIMLECNWPGNVRELENCVERCATMTRGDTIRATDMPCQHGKCFSLVLQGYTTGQRESVVLPVARARLPTPGAAAAPASAAGDAPPDDEHERLVWAMQQCGWVQAKAARLLNITPRQIGYALRKYNVQVRRF
jgi:Nif-specific regulatory protein